MQRALHDLLRPQLGSLVGYKIGCTSKVMQDYLQIPHPCGGGVFERVVHASGVTLPASGYVRVGVECEIVVELAHDIAPADAPFTPARVANAVGAVMAGIEIVDDRYDKGSLLITSQVPVSLWHDVIADPTLGDAILDRFIHNAHRIELKGDSLRRRAGEKNTA